MALRGNWMKNLLDSIVNYALESFLILVKVFLTPIGKYTRDEDIWVFCDRLNGGFSDNSKYLYLHLDQSVTESRPIWLTSNPSLKSQLIERGFEAYLTRELKGIYYILRAGNIATSYGIPTRALGFTGGATLIHLWHGVPLKSLDVSTTLSFHPRNFIRYDFVVANSESEKDSLSKMINFESLIVSGYPRNDIFYNDFSGKNIGVDDKSLAKLSNLDCDLVFGYFPTGREYEKTIPIPFKHLDAELEKINSYLIASPHPHQEFESDLSQFERIIIHPSNRDLYPLFEYIDVMIADYSSIYFDFLHIDRPIIFYPFDLSMYSKNRGFHLDYDSVSPGYHAQSFDMLIEYLHIIRYFDAHDYNRTAVRQQVFEHRDGMSGQRIVEEVRDKR
ncbi:CDP-glycerol glycerophosphotransferase family protein [Halobacterium salinarum]|uniref:CDP-glycerol glycerophosphotransferase family protein n=1 Tax=Halobacterium salinarum TaxID=2242 RepID=UPI0030D552BE